MKRFLRFKHAQKRFVVWSLRKRELFLLLNTSDRAYHQRYFINEINQLKLLYSEKSPYENSIVVQKFENNIKIDKRNQQTQIKNKNLNPNQNINERNQKQNENNQRKDEIKIKDDNKINTEFYDSIFNFLKYVLNEKNNYYTDILEIKNKIDNLNKKYDDTLKEIEELSNKLNNSINQNISLVKYKEKKVSKFKFLELLVLIAIIFCFILYLNKKGYFNENNSNERNGFGNIGAERELNMIDSKLLI
jgi:hypothetical protein